MRWGGDHGRRGGKHGVGDDKAGFPAASRCARQHMGEHVHKEKLGCVSRARPVPSGSGG
jgi:hypothetical protein